MAGLPVRQLGDYIREQRASSQISLRQLAALAGVSNPYLSQIERGLRRPSAEILQQIAKGLRISAEALYVQAGFLDQRDSSDVVDALLADESLNERQKQVLLEIYDSFRKENAALVMSEDAASALADAEPGPASRPAATPSVRPSAAGAERVPTVATRRAERDVAAAREPAASSDPVPAAAARSGRRRRRATTSGPVSGASVAASISSPAPASRGAGPAVPGDPDALVDQPPAVAGA